MSSELALYDIFTYSVSFRRIARTSGTAQRASYAHPTTLVEVGEQLCPLD